MRLAIAALMFASVAFAGPPHLVRDINTTIIPVDSIPGELLDQGSWSFFTAGDGTHAREPWSTDGTAAGTFRLGSVNPLPAGC